MMLKDLDFYIGLWVCKYELSDCQTEVIIQDTSDTNSVFAEAMINNISRRNMKRKKTTLTDLSFDVLSHIMHCVATSSDGAGTFIVLSSVCRVFKDLANDANILKGVNFRGIKLLGLDISFWHRKGLLFRCMVHRNLGAIEFLIEYVDALELSYKEHKRALFRWTVIRLARIGAVDIVNTRSRRKALNVAEEEYQKIYDAVSIDYKKGKELLDMLRAVREARTTR